MKFTIEATDKGSKARAAVMQTDSGVIQTPIFMPVGTVGAVKGVHLKDLEEEIRAQIILGNTYHLYLRPGMEVLEAAGGLHRFNAWANLYSLCGMSIRFLFRAQCAIRVPREQTRRACSRGAWIRIV